MGRIAPIISLLAVFVTAQAHAQAGMRDGDKVFQAAELNALLSGHTVEFYDASVATYRGDGGYTYVYAPGDPPFVGTYTVADGGEVCVTFDNGFSRCDVYVEASGRLVLIVAVGDRYPVRNRMPAEDG